MSNALILILALCYPHIYRTKLQCQQISDILVEVSVHQMFDKNSKHFKMSEELAAIKKFQKECSK